MPKIHMKSTFRKILMTANIWRLLPCVLAISTPGKDRRILLRAMKF